MTIRSVPLTLVAFLVIVTAFHTAPRPAAAQLDCTAPQALAPGSWSGRFEARWTLRWTGELGNQPTSADTAPAVWESTGTVRGDLVLLVPEPDVESAPAVLGVGWAAWHTETTATREDGAQLIRRERGLLSGGSVALGAGGVLVDGDGIQWSGAWWTRPAGSTDATFSRTTSLRSSTGLMAIGDGHVTTRPAEPIVFQVDSVSCQRITGRITPATLGAPERGAETDWMVVSATTTFTLDRRQH